MEEVHSVGRGVANVELPTPASKSVSVAVRSISPLEDRWAPLGRLGIKLRLMSEESPEAFRWLRLCSCLGGIVPSAYVESLGGNLDGVGFPLACWGLADLKDDRLVIRRSPARLLSVVARNSEVVREAAGLLLQPDICQSALNSPVDEKLTLWHKQVCLMLDDEGFEKLVPVGLCSRLWFHRGTCEWGSLGDSRAALGSFEKALGVMNKMGVEKNRLVPETLSRMAACLLFDQSRQLDFLVRAQEAFAQIDGEDSERSLWHLQMICINLHDTERWDESATWGKQLLRLRISKFGESSLEAVETHHRLGLILHKARRFEESLLHFNRCVDNRDLCVGENAFYYPRSLQQMGKVLTDMGRYDEALELLEQALQLFRDNPFATWEVKQDKSAAEALLKKAENSE